LCCSTWLTDFKIVSTSAARYQNLSLNPIKLAGQCGKLKCCLNYELDSYMEAIKDIPDSNTKLQTLKGSASHRKTDILRRIMWFGYDDAEGPAGADNWAVLQVDRVKEILEMNKAGNKPVDLASFVDFEEEEKPVDYADVVGQVGEGFVAMIESVNHDRIFSASRSLGLSRRAQDMACEYAKERITFGARLADHQAIQFMLADNDVEIEAARLMIESAAELVYAGHAQGRIAASRAKLYASEMGCRVTDRVLQVFGGMGYMCDLPIERFYRDARAFRIGEGTSEMQRIQIARHILSSTQG
jgi:hypothetical protein